MLVSHGYSWPGNIAGVDLGAIATNGHGIGPGVYATLGAAAAGTGLGTWQAALPLALVGVALGALAVRDTVRLLLPGSLVAAPVIALLASMASLFGYVTVNYFLAQVLAMPLVLCELMALHWLARRPGRQERVAGLVLLAAVVLTAILSYSPMAFFMQPVIVGAVCVSEVGRGWLRRSAAVVVSTAGAFVVAALLAPVPFARSAAFVRVSFRKGPGWPLGLMTPLDVLGLRPAIRTPRPVVGTFVFEATIVGLIVVASVWTLWNRRRSAALLCGAAALVVLGSYAAVYAERGYSYEQWKWISYFQPVFITAMYALVVAAGAALVARLDAGASDCRPGDRRDVGGRADRGIRSNFDVGDSQDASGLGRGRTGARLERRPFTALAAGATTGARPPQSGQRRLVALGHGVGRVLPRADDARLPRGIPGVLLRGRTHGIRPAQHLRGIVDARARGRPHCSRP